MPLNMPKLDEGRIYRRTEVESFIGTQDGTSDFDLVRIHFPRNLETWNADCLGCRDGEEMLLQYQVYPLAEFKPQISGLADTFAQFDEERRRIEVIVDALLRGDLVHPVFLQQNDPQQHVIEGMHRSVALLQLGCPYLPAFLTGYRNWFTPDQPLASFDREDEIAPASLREACGFFMDATRIDHKGIEPAMLGSDRLRLCDQVFVAKHQGRSIGAVTMTVAKGRPTLSTVYVLKQYRRKGVALRLSEKALLRFKEAGVGEVFCTDKSPAMDATLKRLAYKRPELRAMIKDKIVVLPSHDIEMEDD